MPGSGGTFLWGQKSKRQTRLAHHESILAARLVEEVGGLKRLLIPSFLLSAADSIRALFFIKNMTLLPAALKGLTRLKLLGRPLIAAVLLPMSPK